ncbi:hypothetical protein AVEN_225766-1 [Araneus ventricosus]|uniref:FAS1 domain-containing protein n=1 Tax=Araneus ventricosus TaxID=182803 RepID=A0A4Y2JE95_ARAVE|nr:hypothetical protein AVEN_225766-1 [Araneus ventricosus]
MENVVDTVKSLERTKFFQWIENAGLADQLKTANYTVFTPSNEAIIDFEDETEDNEISAINPAKRLTDTASITKSHIVEGFENIDVLENEQLLKTLDDAAQIRINKYVPAHEKEILPQRKLTYSVPSIPLAAEFRLEDWRISGMIPDSFRDWSCV